MSFWSRTVGSVAGLLATTALVASAVNAPTTSYPSSQSADPGDAVAVITVPVLSPSGLGVSVASDCQGNIYYTNFQSPFLYKIDASGTLLDTKDLTDADTGASLTIGEIAWDDDRQRLWGATDNDFPVRLFLIDPSTGSAEYQFDVVSDEFALTDGLAYEATGSGVIWHSPDVSTDIERFDAVSGASLGTVTPLGADGNPLGSISGVFVGLDPVLYVGRNGEGEIVAVNRNTGEFISSFSSPGGRDEGLECNEDSFGVEVILSKDAFDDTITAIEVQPGTCRCGGVIPVETSTWGRLKSRFRD